MLPFPKITKTKKNPRAGPAQQAPGDGEEAQGAQPVQRASMMQLVTTHQAFGTPQPPETGSRRRNRLAKVNVRKLAKVNVLLPRSLCHNPEYQRIYVPVCSPHRSNLKKKG